MRALPTFACLLTLSSASLHAATITSAAEIAEALSSPSQIVLYSLDPWKSGADTEETVCAGLCYFGWPVLGQIEVAPRSGVATRIVTWLKQPEADDSALCFNPRHGVHVVTQNHTFDFVVCFECEGVEVYVDSKSVAVSPNPADGQLNWDRLLKGAGVRLAAAQPPDEE